MEMNRLDEANIKNRIRKLNNKINNELHRQEDWLNFRIYFESIYPSFFDTLSNLIPNLTLNEQRLCTYIKMKLTNREVANLLYVSIKAIETARYRLKKKIGLDAKVNLNEFINKLNVTELT